MTIDYLKHHPEAIAELAGYAHAEWRRVYDERGMSSADVVASFEARANTETLPLTLVALERGQVFGTGCLKSADLPERTNLSPWMGGLLVVEAHRRKGVATALIERLVTEARRLNLEQLYLWTPSSEALYARLGWTTIETLPYFGYDIAVMRRSL